VRKSAVAFLAVLVFLLTAAAVSYARSAVPDTASAPVTSAGSVDQGRVSDSQGRPAPEEEGRAGDQDQVEEQVEEQVGDQNEADDPAGGTLVGSIAVPDPEPTDLSGLATVTPAQAQAAALTVDPTATVVSTELQNEDSYLVWGVTLSTGTEVKVDAGNGQVLGRDAADPAEKAQAAGGDKEKDVENGSESTGSESPN